MKREGRPLSPVEPERKRTKRRRGEHSTKPKCENPSSYRPELYKALSGQLGHAYNRLVKKDPVTGEQSLRMHMSLHPFYVQKRTYAGRKYAFRPENNASSMPSGRFWSASVMRAHIP